MMHHLQHYIEDYPLDSHLRRTEQSSESHSLDYDEVQKWINQYAS